MIFVSMVMFWERIMKRCRYIAGRQRELQRAAQAIGASKDRREATSFLGDTPTPPPALDRPQYSFTHDLTPSRSDHFPQYILRGLSERLLESTATVRHPSQAPPHLQYARPLQFACLGLFTKRRVFQTGYACL